MLSFFRATNSCSSNPCIPGPHNSTSSPTPKPPGISFSTLSLKSPDPYSPTTPTAASTHYHQVFSPSRLRLGEEPAPEGGLGEDRPSPQEQRGREEAPEAAQEPAEQSSEHSESLSQVIILSFRSDLQWILFCADLPSLIQEGPQCGLVALWMAGTLLAPLSSTPLERLVQVAMERGYTAQGEMFSGVLLGVQGMPSLGYEEDPELPGLFHPAPGTPRQPPSLPEEGSPGAVYLLAKQGKSWHYQLWDYDQVRDSNLQLTDFSPSRAADGREYVVPVGGVRAGLCGQALLLRPQDSGH
ncbi:actin maturation protease isoform X4 [Globicephala melas]|uniref:actin maturation protease isoform X4 n=1 Tax=Globicephala melas TaxID=9731 RepID=UPI00293D2305|nr:actin maturation protease isoform X4 [Globicephala melas]